jgi:hypothetical protein
LERLVLLSFTDGHAVLLKIELNMPDGKGIETDLIAQETVSELLERGGKSQFGTLQDIDDLFRRHDALTLGLLFSLIPGISRIPPLKTRKTKVKQSFTNFRGKLQSR